MSDCTCMLEHYLAQVLQYGQAFQSALDDLAGRAADEEGEDAPELLRLLEDQGRAMAWLRGCQVGLRLASGRDGTHGREAS